MLGIGGGKPKTPTEKKGRVQSGIRFVWDRGKQTWVDLREEIAGPEAPAATERAGAWSRLAQRLAAVALAAVRIRPPKATWKVRAATAFVAFVVLAVALTGLIGIGRGGEEAETTAPGGADVNNGIAELGVSAPTNRWVDFYSLSSTLDGAPLPVGSVITALDPDGVVCGAFSVTRAGGYGLMPVYGDDPDTEMDEGAVLGDRLEFRINDVPAVALGPDDPVWTTMGVAKHVDLAVPAAQ
jgi:hypothetical protein